MNYEEKYKQALERARYYHSKDYMLINSAIENIFPELKESNEELTRKGIIELVKQSSEILDKQNQNNMIAWFEKQGEPNPYSGTSFKYNGNTYGMCIRDGGLDILYNNTLSHHIDFTSQDKSGEKDKVEPKLHKGDWITDGYISYKITEILYDRYIIESRYDKRGAILFEFENRYHLWTINDAKDGDVLAVEPIDSYQLPFVAIYKERGLDYFDSYCCIGFDGKFYESELGHSTKNIHPATKKQRDLLFSKMKEAGYEWNAEKKELKELVEQLKRK